MGFLILLLRDKVKYGFSIFKKLYIEMSNTSTPHRNAKWADGGRDMSKTINKTHPLLAHHNHANTLILRATEANRLTRLRLQRLSQHE